jgi:hypothetical protein
MNGEPTPNVQPASTPYQPPAGPYDGQRPAPARGLDDPRRKSPLLACILSALPGLGQVYVGYYPRGFAHAVIFASLIAILSSIGEFSALFPLAMIFLFFFYFYNIIDAGRRASMFNHVLAGGEIVDLPRDITMPGIRGSIVGGIVTIVVGAIVLSHTAYDMPLDWLEDWWPVALLLLGAYLVVKGFLERSATSDS